MKVFKFFMTLVLGFALIALALGATLDSKWDTTSRVQIGAAKERIFPFINSLKTWPDWTVWNSEKYPDMINKFEGPDAGQGATQYWDDGNMKGVVKITASKANKSIRYRLSMRDGKLTMLGRIHLQKRGDKTLVVWQVSGDAGNNPIGKILMFIYKPMIQDDLNGSLQNLRIMLEK